MKKWSILLTTGLIVLGVVAAPVSVMAQTNDSAATNSVTDDFRLKGGLALVAPRIVEAGHEMSMTVFVRWSQAPLDGVNIWAATSDAVDALKTDIQTLHKDTSIPAATKDYSAVISAHATLLGQTDANGKLSHTFNQTGRFLLISFKKGYYPDWSALNVISITKVLAIHAPPTAHVNDTVTISVNQRGEPQAPVENASVWMVDKDRIAALRTQVQTLNQDTSIAAADRDYESVLSITATRLGMTDVNGKLTHTFTVADRYLLVTVKKGYIPGFTPIVIKALPSPTATTTAGN